MHYIVLLSLLFVSYTASAQKASNIKFEKISNGTILINYTLEGNSMMLYHPTITFSLNNGASFSIAPKSLSGDINTPVSVGTERQIVWEMEKDLGYVTTEQLAVQFKFSEAGPAAGNSDYIYDYADKMPELIGGVRAIYMFLTYPDAARKSGVEGNATVTFVVEKDGSVSNLVAVQTPHESLGEATINALKKVKFKPALVNGEPVRMRMSHRQSFKLNV